MILLLLSFLIIIPTLIGWGFCCERFFQLKLNAGWPLQMINGILGITLFWSLLSFFSPLNGLIEIASIFLGLSVFIYHKLYHNIFSTFKNHLFLKGLLVVIILFCASFHPFILDHFGYYIPTIKWLTDYGLVKGISNLDLTLSQVSFWHIFQAGFSHYADPLLRINTYLLIAYSFYAIERKQWFHLLFIPILLLFTQSPSPDLAVIVISLIILNEILLENKNTKALLTLSAFVFIIKPTMIWVPIVAFLYDLKESKFTIKKYFFPLVLIVLFISKNLWTFGFPIFPMSTIDFNIPWKPHPEMMKMSSEFALNKSFDNVYSNEEIRKFTFLETIKNWLFIGGIKSMINISFIVSLLVFFIFSLLKRKKIYYIILFAILVKSIFVLLFSAQYRFFIDVFFVIFTIIIGLNLKKKIVTIASFAMFTGVILFFSFPTLVQNYIPSFKLGQYLSHFTLKQLYEPSTYQYNQYKKYKVGNLSYNVSYRYPFNFDTPAPCISASYISDYEKFKIFPQLIDSTNIKKGFYTKELNTKELKELKIAIQNMKATTK